MSILTAQPIGVVVISYVADGVHQVDVVRRSDIDSVVLKSDGDKRIVDMHTIHNRRTSVRVDLPAYVEDESLDDRQARRDLRDSTARAIMDSVVADDADVVWTYQNRGWTRVPDRKTT